MTITRFLSRRAAVVLAVATATVGTAGWAVAADHDAAPVAQSVDEPRDDASLLPEGVRDGSRLFITKYRSVIVDVDRDGEISLIEPTGWDTCYFLHEDEVIRYPC